MEMKRAYAELTIKAAPSADKKRRFTGIATTPTADRSGDIVEPKGADFKLPLPLLWQHDSADPIGWITSAKVTPKGIEVDGEVADIAEDGPLKQRLKTAWQMIEGGLVRGLSIGFRPTEYEPIDKKDPWGPLKFIKWLWLELSAVTIPANGEATILAIKSADRDALAAIGRKAAQSTTSRRFGANQGNLMKTLKEMREALQVKQARMDELAEIRKSTPDDFGDEQREEMQTLVDDCRGLQDDILDAQRLQIKASGARQVSGDDSEGGTTTRARTSPHVLSRKQDPDDKFKGQSFTRVVIAKALAMAHNVSPAAIAEARWGKSHPKLVEFIKATVAGGGTGSGEWGAELAASDTRFTGDFVEYLYSKTVFDRLNLRSVPGRVHVKGQDGAFTGYWTGESKAIPMSKGDFSDVELLPLKLAALTVISLELMEDSSPAAEGIVNDGLAEAIAQKADTTFFSAVAASAGVSPAGIVNGVTPIQPSGADSAAVRTDLQALLYPFVTGKMASGLTLVMNPATAMAIGFLYGSLDQPSFPTINQNGGTLSGMPVLVGDNIPGGQIFVLRTQDIWKIGDSGIQVSMSREATIEQRDDPTGATDTPTGVTTTGLTNMFQEDSIAFKVTRRLNWQKRRAGAAAYLDNAEYGGVVS